MRNGTKRTCPVTSDGTESNAGTQIIKESVDEFLNRQAQEVDERTSSGLVQRRAALAKGNAVRFERSRVRSELVSGELDFDEFLDEPSACCKKVPVLRLLQWLPNIGRTRARQIVGCLPDGAGFDVRVDELTARDKYALSADVGRHLAAYRRSVFAA